MQMVGRRDARHACEKKAPAELRTFEILCAFLNAHAAGDLAHRRQAGQIALPTAQRLIRDRRDARGQHVPGQVFACGEVEVREHHLPGAQQRPFLRLRLLYFDDEVRLAVHDRGRRGDLSACLGVMLVRNAAAETRAGLNDHTMTCPGEFFHAGRNHADAILILLDFSGYTDLHEMSFRQPSPLTASAGSSGT